MGRRYIDADKLKMHYAWWQGGTREMTMDEAKHDFDTIIDLQPTIEAEPKRGRWMTDYVEVGSHTGGVATVTVTYCSVCGEQFDWQTPYCPNCGAKMDESTMGQVKPTEGVNEKDYIHFSYRNENDN